MWIKSRTGQSCPRSRYIFHITHELLARAIRKLKEFQSIQIRKETVKIPLFVDDMIVYMSDSKNSAGRCL